VVVWGGGGPGAEDGTTHPPPPPAPQLGSIYFEQLSCGIMFLLEMKNANMLIGSDLEVQ